ncbi:MAG: hypothetical protein RQ745_10400 [Longimicrobiales bacterium]|nr:hypothetical protein [Longimicrobiales bacterium]
MRVWRAWAALCLVAGVVLVPLFLEVFSGGSPARFLALPLRYVWAFALALPILRAGWIPVRPLAIVLVGLTGTISAITLAELSGWIFTHPGWFLALEWWQRPIYPWIEAFLPRGRILDRPLYLWITSIWNGVEGAALAHYLFWHVRPGLPARASNSTLSTSIPPTPSHSR